MSLEQTWISWWNNFPNFDASTFLEGTFLNATNKAAPLLLAKPVTGNKIRTIVKFLRKIKRSNTNFFN
jgi:hypothetical protein